VKIGVAALVAVLGVFAGARVDAAQLGQGCLVANRQEMSSVPGEGLVACLAGRWQTPRAGAFAGVGLSAVDSALIGVLSAVWSEGQACPKGGARGVGAGGLLVCDAVGLVWKRAAVAARSVEGAALEVGAVTSEKLARNAVAAAHVAPGAVLNRHVGNGAAVAGSKIHPDFGGQDVVTTGALQGAEVVAGVALGVAGVAQGIDAARMRMLASLTAARTEGTPCTADDRLSVSATGDVLVCKALVWVKGL